MEMLKIEQVIVGSEVKSTSTEIKSEPVVIPLQPNHQHEGLQCFQCLITFSDFKAKERHMKKTHREQYKNHLQQVNTLFTCYRCDKCFSSSEELSEHQATHISGEKPFLCIYCQKSFHTFTEVNKHRGNECKERQYPCRDCVAVFPSRPRLRRHRKAVHLELPEEPDEIYTYQCYKCCRGFQTEEQLLQHLERFPNDVDCETKLPGKKRGRKPKNTAQGGIVDVKKIKQEEETREFEGYDESPTEGCHSKEKQTQLKIPCPETACDLEFPSVAALRAHKREKHGPPCKT
ncbi:zinc finger protein 883-like [Solea solea]|uniref:zinc finger protein 883-like n=1 Tax=Solea solea TaxID=90069 RepID=UPI00272CD476|nr:zinc finger protein 883-like [Solea solea]